MRHVLHGFSAFALAVLLLTGCGKEQQATVIENPTEEGAAVVQLDGFSVEAQEFTENGEVLYILDYPTPDDAQADRDAIAANGSAIGDTPLTWDAPVHFFHNGTRMVIYVGARQQIIDNLKAGAGDQFAGN